MNGVDIGTFKRVDTIIKRSKELPNKEKNKMSLYSPWDKVNDI